MEKSEWLNEHHFGYYNSDKDKGTGAEPIESTRMIFEAWDDDDSGFARYADDVRARQKQLEEFKPPFMDEVEEPELEDLTFETVEKEEELDELDEAFLAESTYRGISGTTWLWHGEWADPEVAYRGRIFNVNDIEDHLWSVYEDECFDNGTDATEDGFDKWIDGSKLDDFYNDFIDSVVITDVINDMKKIADENHCIDFSNKGKTVQVAFESTDEANDFMSDLEASYLISDGLVTIVDAVQPNEHEDESHILISITDRVNESLENDNDDFELDTDFDTWADIERQLDIADDDYSDEELANIYGGDRTYCPDCGRRLSYDDGYSYCPQCNPIREGWTVFNYKSGANPYIAKTDAEVDRLVKKYGDKARKVGDHYEVDDHDDIDFENDFSPVDESIKSPVEVNAALDKFRKEASGEYDKPVEKDDKEILTETTDGKDELWNQINNQEWAYNTLADIVKKGVEKGWKKEAITYAVRRKIFSMKDDFGRIYTTQAERAELARDFVEDELPRDYKSIKESYCTSDSVSRVLTNYVTTIDGVTGLDPKRIKELPRNYRLTSSSLLGGRVYDHGTVLCNGTTFVFRVRNNGTVKVMTDAQAGSNWSETIFKEGMEGRYCIVARTNDGKFKFYKDGAFVDDYKEATIFTDMDEARSEWFDIDKSKYKRVFIPNYDESHFASLNENKEDDLYDYKTRQATGDWDRDDNDPLLNQDEHNDPVSTDTDPLANVNWTMYSIANREHEKRATELVRELARDGFMPHDSRQTGSKYYVICAKPHNNRGIWKAVQYSNQLEPRVIDITYEQAIGNEPLDDFDGLRRHLGKMLLPHNEDLNESSNVHPDALEPRQRTAVDDVTWWVPFDTATGKYVTTLMRLGNKFKTKKACQQAIDRFRASTEDDGLNEATYPRNFKLGENDIQYVKVYNQYGYTIQEIRIDNVKKTFERGNFSIGHDKAYKNRQVYEDFIEELIEMGYKEIPSDYRCLRNKTRKGVATNEGYETLDGVKVAVYSDYNIAKTRASELGLKEAEYGDIYASDISYCYWNKSGDRNDTEEVIAYYKFDKNGKPSVLTADDREYLEIHYELTFDNALTEDYDTYGSWSVDFDLTLEGEEVRFDDLSEVTQEHIAECIKDGVVQGEICEDDDCTGWWVAKIECYLDDEGDVLFDSLDEVSQEHIADCIKDGYTSGELCVTRDTLTEAPVVKFSDDDLNNPDEVNFRKIIKKAQDEEDAAKAQAELDAKRAELKAQYGDVLDRVAEMPVDTDDNFDRLEALFEVLVPAEGKADTVAGECIRATMRLIYRYYNDGDYFFMGYGLETAAPAVSYLTHRYEDMIYDAQSIGERFANSYDDDKLEAEYEKFLRDLSEVVIEDIIEHPELLGELNEEDSRNTDADWIEDEQPRFETDFMIGWDISEMLDADIVSTREVQEYVEDCLNWDDVFNGCEVSYDGGDYVYVSELTYDGYNELMDRVKGKGLDIFWEEFINDHADELEEFRNKEDEPEDEEIDESLKLTEARAVEDSAWKKFVAGRKTIKEDISDEIDEEDVDKPFTYEQTEAALREITHNFTDESGEVKCFFRQEKDDGRDILKHYYRVVEVSDGRHSENEPMCYVIAYAERDE